MQNLTPEQQARQIIDSKLIAAGWIIQNIGDLNPRAALGVAVREYPTDSGPADYILFVDKKPVSVIEAKRIEAGEHLTTVEDQTYRYANSQLKWSLDSTPLQFLYESTGVLTQFTDLRDPSPRSRLVFSFHRPETFKKVA